MLKKYTETFINKLSIAVINFLIVAFTSQQLGAVVRGEISIFISNLTILLLISNLVGGAAIAFFSNKMNAMLLLTISGIGAFMAALAAYLFFTLGGYTSAFDLAMLILLTGTCNNLQSLLIGKGQMRSYNYALLLQPAVLAITLLIFYYADRLNVLPDYIHGLYISYIVALIVMLILSKPVAKGLKAAWSKKNINEVVRFSANAGISNILQFFNYRLSFYVLLYFSGKASVGLVSVAVSVAEGIWIIGNSIAVNLYAQLLNEPDAAKKDQLTKKAFRISLMATMVAVAVLVFIPASVYGLIFGDEFYELKSLLVLLAPGIIFIGSSNVLGYYFSATGALRINNIKSLIGLLSTLVFAILLVQMFDERGACMAYSISYLCIFIWYVAAYHKRNPLNISDFVLKRSDLRT